VTNGNYWLFEDGNTQVADIANGAQDIQDAIDSIDALAAAVLNL